jgi:hypothetical protein
MTYQVQNRHFHHALIEVGCAVLDHLDCNHFLGLEILALDDLAERALAEDIQNKIAISKPDN